VERSGADIPGGGGGVVFIDFITVPSVVSKSELADLQELQTNQL
jgi:hypothetical protein